MMLAWTPILMLGLLGVVPGLLWGFTPGDQRFALTSAALALIGIPVAAWFLARRKPNAFVHVLATYTVAGGVFGVTMVLTGEPSATRGDPLAEVVGQALLAIVFSFVLGLVYGLLAVWIKRMRTQAAPRAGPGAPGSTRRRA